MSPNLFQDQVELISLDHGELKHYTHFFSSDEAQFLFQCLQSSLTWQQDVLSFGGKEVPVPRLQAWYGDTGRQYTYSGLTMNPREWTPELLSIKTKIEQITGYMFNSVLANYYRDGNDSVSWHSDDEPELGKNPVIASLSLGDTRRFVLKRKNKSHKDKFVLELVEGSLLVMAGETQHFWQHSIPKTKSPVGPRINLTFRNIIDL